MVHFSNVSFSHPGKKVFSNLDYKFEKKKIHALIGPSGCGKTTLLYLALGLKTPSEGAVLIEGAQIIKGSLKTAVVFQDHGLFPWKTAEENIALGMKIRKLPRASKMAAELLEEMGLQGLNHKYPGELSGGEQQRLAVARALAVNPELLLLDEPFGALDAMTRENLQDKLSQIQENHKLTMILVTHSIEEAVFLGDHIHVMSKRGEITKIDNFSRGPAYRRSQEYFDHILDIRKVLEGASS